MNKSRDWLPSQVRYIFKRDEGSCIYCGEPASQIDHVIPVKDGGPTITSNGVCACRRCNGKKYDKLEMDCLTRAIFWLMQHDEDVAWMEEFYATLPSDNKK